MGHNAQWYSVLEEMVMDKFWVRLSENKGRKIVLIFLVIFFALAVLQAVFNRAEAASLNLTCVPPTEREDGTPLPASEIAGYWWYRDGAKDNDTLTPDCAYTMIAPDGTFMIQAQTVDTGGLDSQLSPGKQKQFQTARPLNPTVE